MNNNATSSLDIFVEKLSQKGYRMEGKHVDALNTPYLVDTDLEDRVIVLSPIWTGDNWTYEHSVGRKFIYGESFIRMLPNMNGNNSYLDREFSEEY